MNAYAYVKINEIEQKKRHGQWCNDQRMSPKMSSFAVCTLEEFFLVGINQNIMEESEMILDILCHSWPWPYQKIAYHSLSELIFGIR